MRFVFFKHQLTFPRQTGHDVHTSEMMRALAAKGHSVVFLSRTTPDAGALDGLGLASSEVLTAEDADSELRPEGLQARFFCTGASIPATRLQWLAPAGAITQTSSSRWGSMRCPTWWGRITRSASGTRPTSGWCTTSVS